MPQPDDTFDLIVITTGDTPDTRIRQNLPLWWALHADKGVNGGALQRLYTTRDAERAMYRYLLDKVTTTVADIQTNYSDRAKAMLKLIEDTTAEIATEEARLASIGTGDVSGTVGEMLTVAPSTPPFGFPDANSLDYFGNPYRAAWSDRRVR